MVKTTLAFLLVSFLALPAAANFYPTLVPAGSITVRDNVTGKVKTYDLAEYAVVKRRKPGPTKPKPKKRIRASEVCQNTFYPVPCQCHLSGDPGRPLIERIETIVTLKNRVRAFGGIGPNGLELENGNQVSTYQGIVGGVGYDRLLTDRFSVGVQGMTNRTFTLGAGFDF